MDNGSTFKFTFVAAVALGVGLMIVGCGDGGSTAPNPLNGSTHTPTPPEPIPPTPPSPSVNQVIFDYNILPSGTMEGSGISADIAKVRYAFSYTDEQENVLVDIKDAYTCTFEHKSQDYQQQVYVKDVTTEPTKVTAAYYDVEGELVALGINELEWDRTTKNAYVTNPQIWHLGVDPNVALKVSPYVVPKNGQTSLTFEVAPEGKEAVDMTAFAVVDNIDENVLAAVDKQPGKYNGINYSGSAGEWPVLSIGTKLKRVVERAIFVTDQEIASIKMRPADIEGKQITVDNNSFQMHYTDNKDDFATQNVLHMTNTLGAEVGEYTAAVNDQPMQVWAAYGAVPEKGPTPPDIDITDDDQVTISHKFESIGTDYMEVKDKTLHLKGKNPTGSNSYSVSAQWDKFTSDALTVTVVDVFDEAYLYFVNKDTGALIPEKIKYSGSGENIYNMYLGTAVMSMDSNWNFYRSDIVDIPASWISQGKYPNVLSVSLSPSGVSEYKQESPGANSYILKVSGAPVANINLAIERSGDAPYPKLQDTYVVP